MHEQIPGLGPKVAMAWAAIDIAQETLAILRE